MVTKVRCSIFSPSPVSLARCVFTALLGIALLVGCGGGSSTTATPTLGPTTLVIRPTTTPPPTIDPVHIRTGSAVIPSPTGQSANSVGNPPGGAPTPPPPSAMPPTVPIPTGTTGIVLQPLAGGQTFATADKKVTIHYPDNWDAQTAENAAQFMPKGASPTDPNVPRVTFNGLPVQLGLLSDDNAANYLQNLAAQTAGRGATDLKVRSIDRVRLGNPNGQEAVRFIVSYTQGVPVTSEQVAIQPNGSDTTYFISATAPAADFATTWEPIIDGIAGSAVFS